VKRALLVTVALTAACAGAPPKPEASVAAPVPESLTLPEGIKAADAAPSSGPSMNEGEARQLETDAAKALDDGDDAKAESLLLKVLASRPDDALASENLTRLRLKQGRTGEAQAELASRIAQMPGSLPLRVQYVRVLIAQDKLDQALVEAKKVLKADERNVPALLGLADAWYREKKFELARDVLENAAAIDPKNAEVANAQGFVHLATEQKPLAIEDFKRACELGPRFAEAHNNLGALLNEASDFEGGAKELEQAAKIEPGRSAIWLNLGNAYRGARRYEEAEAAYKKALELNPQNPNPLFNLGILYLDGEIKGKQPLERLAQSTDYFQRFKKAGGVDARLARYEGEAEKTIKKERDRLAREDRDRLKKVEAARKIEEEKRRREAGKLGHLEEDDGPAPAAPAAPKESAAPRKVPPQIQPASAKIGGEEK
jgi:Flp pilus assembly protein TadD